MFDSNVVLNNCDDMIVIIRVAVYDPCALITCSVHSLDFMRCGCGCGCGTWYVVLVEEERRREDIGDRVTGQDRTGQDRT